jgi:histidinol dehydrogenase
MASHPRQNRGVGRIVMTTPPYEDGSVPDVILAAAQIASSRRS